jgi:hypothetical protein
MIIKKQFQQYHQGNEPNKNNPADRCAPADFFVLHEMKRIWIPQTVASAMLVWALNPENPYGYYVLLRWVCCGVFGFLTFHALGHKMQGWSWTLGITALVYNPIFRIHLTREIWVVVNIVTIGIAIVSIFRLPIKKDSRSKGEEE